MKIERTKNSLLGIISGFVNKIVSLILPFFVKSIFIRTLGIQYFGLNSLFTSVLSILNLAELGVGTAISYSMYSAIANDDKDMICALTNLYRKTYRIIGITIFFAGILFTPFIPMLCSTDVPPDINLYILYVMYLLNTAISYMLFAYKSSILVSHQKNYIINNINTVVNIVLNVSQAIILLIGKNYYWYLFLIILSTILYNLLIAFYTNIKFKEYKPIGEIDKVNKEKIYSKIKALFFYKIGSVVLTSVDSIVISYFLGLTVLGKYNGYYYVITTLFGFFQIYSNSLVAGIGNSIEVESKNKNQTDFKKLNFLQGWIVLFCTISLIVLYQNFIYLWLGEEFMFPFEIVIALAIYFYTWKMMDIVNLYKDAAGLWEYDKYRPLVASIVNLILNIFLVNIIGIYGIVLSTIVSIVFIIFPWSTYILFKKYFFEGYGEYIKGYLYNAFVTLLTAFVCIILSNMIKDFSITSFLLRIIICIIVPNIMFLIFNLKSSLLRESIFWILSKLNKNIKKDN